MQEEAYVKTARSDDIDARYRLSIQFAVPIYTSRTGIGIFLAFASLPLVTLVPFFIFLLFVPETLRRARTPHSWPRSIEGLVTLFRFVTSIVPCRDFNIIAQGWLARTFGLTLLLQSPRMALRSSVWLGCLHAPLGCRAVRCKKKGDLLRSVETAGYTRDSNV